MTSSFPSLPLALVLLLCGLFASSWATSRNHDVLMMDRFHRWMAEHARSYPSADEKLRRFEIYRRNVEYIETTNRDGGLSYELGENQFTDLTNEEFLARQTSYAPELLLGDAEEEDMLITTRAGDVAEGCSAHVNLSAVPESVDWRTAGAVTAVKNQGQCGACWAFAAVAAMESLNKIKNGALVTLSEQELVDCDTFSKDSCTFGKSDSAFRWIRKNGGLTTDSDYPYTFRKGTCDPVKVKHHAVTITGYRRVQSNREDLLMAAVAEQPVTVVIEAGENFQTYKGGLYRGPCGKNFNHIVTIVGYGKDARGAKYWIVKNSYGPTWGDGGYIHMARDIADPQGLCGLAFWPTYPTM